MLAIARMIAPNLLLAVMMLLSISYYQTELTGGSPTWRNVAVGSMAIVGTLAGLGYRDFVGRMRKLETALQVDRDKRDVQHKANMRAIVALAMANGDQQKIADAVTDLLAPRGPDG